MAPALCVALSRTQMITAGVKWRDACQVVISNDSAPVCGGWGKVDPRGLV